MSRKTKKSRKIIELARCLRRFPSGRRCRRPISDNSSYYCESHAHLRPPEDLPLDFSRELTADGEEFTSASDINQFLSKLLLLLSQDRIAPRCGAVLAYTCNLLLRTLPAIKLELERELHKDRDPRRFILDLPCPDREREGL